MRETYWIIAAGDNRVSIHAHTSPGDNRERSIRSSLFPLFFFFVAFRLSDFFERTSGLPVAGGHRGKCVAAS
jgi:hypothetical protein